MSPKSQQMRAKKKKNVNWSNADAQNAQPTRPLYTFTYYSDENSKFCFVESEVHVFFFFFFLFWWKRSSCLVLGSQLKITSLASCKCKDTFPPHNFTTFFVFGRVLMVYCSRVGTGFWSFWVEASTRLNFIYKFWRWHYNFAFISDFLTFWTYTCITHICNVNRAVTCSISRWIFYLALLLKYWPNLLK